MQMYDSRKPTSTLAAKAGGGMTAGATTERRHAMNYLLILVLWVSSAASAMASDATGNTPGMKPSGNYTYTPPAEARQGGDTIADANPVPALPYVDAGTTVGYVNDYDESCPFGGSQSPDVVYSYSPAVDLFVTADLCTSFYDTKMYIYAGGVGNLVACNDDAGCGYSGYQSRIEYVPLLAGTTYYFVVDGFGSASGDYEISIFDSGPPPPIECPPDALEESEPACEDGYVDNFNGGCNSVPPVFQPVDAQNGVCATMCGYSCNYMFDGLSYRDTDWFESFGIGADVSIVATAEFPMQLLLIYGPDCVNLQYLITTVPAYTTASLTYPIAQGARVWTWIGPSVFNGIPSSRYMFEICGIDECAFHAARIPTMGR